MKKPAQIVFGTASFVEDFEEVIAEFSKHRKQISRRALEYMKMSRTDRTPEEESEEYLNIADILVKYDLEVTPNIPPVQDGDIEELLAYKKMFDRDNPNNVARLLIIERLMPMIQGAYDRDSEFSKMVPRDEFLNQAWTDAFVRISQMLGTDDPMFISMIRGSICQSKINCRKIVIDHHCATNEQYVRKVVKARDRYIKEQSTEPTPEILAEMTGYPVTLVKQYLRQSNMQQHVPIDRSDDDAENDSFDYMYGTFAESTESYVLQKIEQNERELIEAIRERGGDVLVDILLHQVPNFAPDLAEEFKVPRTKREICARHKIKPIEFDQIWEDFKDSLRDTYMPQNMLMA